MNRIIAASRIGALLFVTLMIASCGESIVGPERDFADAQEKWRASKAADYDLVVSRICECLPGTMGPVEVIVRGGRVSSRRYLTSSAEVPDGFMDVFPDVENLFFKIRSALWAHVYKIEVEYDEELGYPTRIYVDPDKGVADDEVQYAIGPLTVR